MPLLPYSLQHRVFRVSVAVVSNSFNFMDCRPPGCSVHGILCGRNTGEVCHALLQGILLTQRLNPHLLSPALAGGFFIISATWKGHAHQQKLFPSLPLWLRWLPLAMRETWVRSLGWEDPLEKGKAAHASILAGRILWTLEWRSQRVGHD